MESLPEVLFGFHVSLRERPTQALQAIWPGEPPPLPKRHGAAVPVKEHRVEVKADGRRGPALRGESNSDLEWRANNECIVNAMPYRYLCVCVCFLCSEWLLLQVEHTMWAGL